MSPFHKPRRDGLLRDIPCAGLLLAFRGEGLRALREGRFEVIARIYPGALAEIRALAGRGVLVLGPQDGPQPVRRRS